MRLSKKKLNNFIAVWDITGLESLHDVDAARFEMENWEKLRIVSILKEETHPAKPRSIPLQMILLRARYNSQRHYEIYEFATALSYNEVKEIFEKSPQVMVDAIRECGYEIYSDRVLKKTQVIT